MYSIFPSKLKLESSTNRLGLKLHIYLLEINFLFVKITVRFTIANLVTLTIETLVPATYYVTTDLLVSAKSTLTLLLVQKRHIGRAWVSVPG